MTKSNRHKKQRKQEKAKTQLTGVKKLAKPQNVVEPTLRVKKILIREQLKTSSLPPLGSSGLKDGSSSQVSDVASEADSGVNRWKQSVPELLATANHHNTNMKKDAIIGLQEIAASKSSAIIRHLDRILVKIAALTMDQESAVRKENIKLSGMVLSMITEVQLRPFWSMVIAHLKCTMTHLILAVRCNVLPFIELLIDYHPRLVYESNSVLLPGLLGLISTSSKDALKQKSVTKLKTEITGKHDDVAVRLKVLNLLSKCLNLSYTVMQSRVKANTANSLAKPTEYLAPKYPFGYCWGQSEEELASNNFSSDSYADRFFSTITADPFASPFSSEPTKKDTVWQDFVNACLPVLVETWVEVGPSVVDEDHQSTYKSGRKNQNQKQTSRMQIGNDMNRGTNVGRRNGLHVLSDTNIETLCTATTLLQQLLQSNGMCLNCNGGDIELEEQTQLAKAIKKVHGINLTKYYFTLLPYEPLKESRRKDVTAVNLKLFLIAGKLKMFDNNMKKKLQIFIEGILESSSLEDAHCKLLLDVIKFVDVHRVRNLPTKFLVTASKLGHHKLITDFLKQKIHPASYELQSDKTVLDMVSSFDWNVIIDELVNSWPINNKNESHYLFELLTFIALRKLADMKSILQSCIHKLKKLVSVSEVTQVWDSAHRAFEYAEADDLFEAEFSSISQS